MVLQSLIVKEPYEEILVGLTIVFAVASIIFIISYYRRALTLRKEYVEAKDIVSRLVLSFRRRQDDQDKKITDLKSETESIHSAIERLTEQNRMADGKISSLIANMKSAFTINKKLITHVTTMREDIIDLSKKQQIMQEQFTTLNERYQRVPETLNTVVEDEHSLVTKLTETEEQIIQFLLTDGPKTAPAVEEKIAKTREHTARLMKKLWQEGYIERETHRIPFVYRANEKLKKSLEAKG